MGLRYCKEGEWHFMRRGRGSDSYNHLLGRGYEILMRPVMRDYFRHFRLAPVKCVVNVFRILGSVDALNEQMGLRLTHHDVLVLQSLVPQG